MDTLPSDIENLIFEKSIKLGDMLKFLDVDPSIRKKILSRYYNMHSHDVITKDEASDYIRSYNPIMYGTMNKMNEDITHFYVNLVDSIERVVYWYETGPLCIKKENGESQLYLSSDAPDDVMKLNNSTFIVSLVEYVNDQELEANPTYDDATIFDVKTVYGIYSARQHLMEHNSDYAKESTFKYITGMYNNHKVNLLSTFKFYMYLAISIVVLGLNGKIKVMPGIWVVISNKDVKSIGADPKLPYSDYYNPVTITEGDMDSYYDRIDDMYRQVINSLNYLKYVVA